MNKFICFICCLLFFSQSVFASNTNESINEEDFNVLKDFDIISDDRINDEYVTRQECIISIMKCLGADEKMNKEYMNTLFYQPIFLDRWNFKKNPNSENGYIINRNPEYGYILLAGLYEIARGSYFSRIDEYGFPIKTEKPDIGCGMYFLPDEKVTYKEAALFMARCLYPFDKTYKSEMGNKIYSEDDNIALNKAYDLGLLNNDNINEYLPRTEFYRMLYIFINQKMYFYRDYNSTMDLLKNESDEITYLKHLSNHKN